jgi:YD repeat-containing protein
LGVVDPEGITVRVGSLLQKDEYDFSNVLTRSTLNRYQWQDNASYFNNNLVSLPEWSTVYNGAAPSSTTLPACSSTGTPACISQSKYAYDEGTRGSSGIGAPTHVAAPAGDSIRGNMTTASRWLDTTSSFVSGTSTYLDTGMKATSTDALNRITSYTYSSGFQGAYLTQTNLPDTQMPDSGATVVHHIITGDYDFNTGLLTKFTDENSQSYTYTYDNMLRLTEGDHPDQGVTKFSYPDSNTVERQRLITGTTFDDYKVKFDGLGRAYQTQQLTPDCPSYIKVDTLFDLIGRPKSVSNPYCLTSETTYGTTQAQYDALSRTTTTTKQDNSVTTVVYNDTPADTSGAPLVCTTAVDESGKRDNRALTHLVVSPKSWNRTREQSQPMPPAGWR